MIFIDRGFCIKDDFFLSIIRPKEFYLIKTKVMFTQIFQYSELIPSLNFQ